MPDQLSERERRFVAAMYSPAARLCATKAARIAGYSSGGSYGPLRVSASRLLKRPRVRRALHEDPGPHRPRRFRP